MDAVIRELARWREKRTGHLGDEASEEYLRVHERLGEIAAAQQLAARSHTPLFQTELNLMGPAGGRAAGYLFLRHHESRECEVRVASALKAATVECEVPPRLRPRETVQCRVSVDLSQQLAPRVLQAALDVQVDGAHRLRIWIRVEVV